MIFSVVRTSTNEEIRNALQIDNMGYVMNQETIEKGSTLLQSGVWLDFHRILFLDNNVMVENFVSCIHCNGICAYHGSTTTRLRDHRQKCPKRRKIERDGPSKIAFKSDELVPLHHASAQFIVEDLEPYLAIEGNGLHHLIYEGIQLGLKHPEMTLADLKVALPTRNTVKARVKDMTIVGTNYLARKVRNSLDHVGKIAATTDMWTKPNNSSSIITLTLHFFTIDETKLNLECFTADLVEVPQLTVTGSVVKQAILDMFATLDVTGDEVQKNVCMVTDRGSNMLSAMADIDSEVCTSHLGNNLVGHMLKVPEAKEILHKASALVTYFKKSHVGSQMDSELKSYPETRFNYANDMLKSIHDNYTEAYDVLLEKQNVTKVHGLTDKITCLSQEKLKAMCDFLVFFKKLTNAIEGDKNVTLHRECTQ